MEWTPSAAVTGRTVSAADGAVEEDLAIGAVGGNQATVGIVTGRTSIVSISCGADQQAVGMTASTISGCNRDQ